MLLSLLQEPAFFVKGRDTFYPNKVVPVSYVILQQQDMELKQIILELEALNGIKFGSFQLKNGITSPVYFDLRVIISRPRLLREISRILWRKVEKIVKPNLLCGVPYTALPIATLISNETEIPMLIRRKEVKNYGTKKIIEGSYENGQNCLIIEVRLLFY